MVAHKIQNPPSNRRINGAFHQDEGIRIRLADYREFTFVIKGSKTGKEGFQLYTGVATEIIEGKFAKDSKSAEMEIEFIESPEREGYLTFVETSS